MILWIFDCCRLFKLVDTVCVSWFSLEFSVRFISTPNVRKFFRNPLNIIDILALLPYVVLLIAGIWITYDQIHQSRNLSLVVRIVKVARAARILKLSRYSRALRILGKTLTSSSDVFFLLLCFHLMMAFTFASLVFALDGPTEPYHRRPKPAPGSPEWHAFKIKEKADLQCVNFQQQ